VRCARPPPRRSAPPRNARLRTVYLGTSPFAAAVLERLAAGPHRPALVVTRPDRPKGRGRALQSPAVADTARRLGLELIQPERPHAPEALERIAAAEPDVLVLCAYGVLVSEPLLSRYEIFNVHPSLLPRWRGAAPIERAIMAGDAETGVSIMRLAEGFDAGPVCLRGTEPIRPDDDYGTLAARLEGLAGELLERALDERPPWVEQDESGVTYARKIEAADRALDPARTPAELERTVRALRPHIGARLPLPGGGYLGVHAAAVDGPTLAPAGGRVRTDGERLLLDCRGGALELTEVQPPGGRPMPAQAWLRGRPDPALTDFRLDPRMPDRDVAELVRLAVAEWDSGEEWAPYISALGWRGTPDVLAALEPLADDPDARARSVAAYVAGQLGAPLRTLPAESAALLERMGERESDPRVLAVIAEAFGNLGEPWGLGWLLRMRDHADAAVRDGVAAALAGRSDPAAVEALIELSADADGGVRDWATFALGALAEQDSAELRDALVARLGDADPDARIEAVHGLALRGDVRAVEPALALLEAGERGGSLWTRHALQEAAIRLAALSGDARFAPHLPALDDGWRGTTLERELTLALERCGGGY
jgi:methionyl-tRNA formyltransferase